MKLYDISLGNLRRRKGKMFFLLSGLLMGIATIVALVSVTESMTGEIEESLNKFGANIVMTPASETLSLTYGGMTVGGVNVSVSEFDESGIWKIREIKNSQNLGVVAPKILGSVVLGEKQVMLMGVDFSLEMPLKTWWMPMGKVPEKPDEIMIGTSISRIFGLSQGDSVNMHGDIFRVTAVLEEMGTAEDGMVIGHLSSFQKILGKEGKVSMVEISAFCRGCPISEMVLQIAEKFPGARVTALKQAVMSKMQSVEMFKSFSFGVAALVAVIGSLLVFVTMMGSVNERTREIGIFRAMGFRKGHVMQIILLEAMIVGLLGGVAGFLIGSGVAGALVPVILKGGAYAGLNMKTGAMSVFLSVSLSLFASLYPAIKASSLDPSEALRVI